MAQEHDLSKAADKGKGKAVEDVPQKDKSGQAVPNGKKKDDEKGECGLTYPRLRSGHDASQPPLPGAYSCQLVLTSANSYRGAQRGGSAAEERA
jgi:hypothetical protein